jgi:hypothetical protein
MAVASGVLAVVVLEDANGAERRVVVSMDTRCDLELVDRLLRLRQAVKAYGATVRLEQVHPMLVELLELIGVSGRFQRRAGRGAPTTPEQWTR